MKIFRDDKLEKQMNTIYKNRKDIIDRLDKITNKLINFKSIEECNSDKGFKKFKGISEPIYAFDIGLNNSATTAGERLIVSFIDLNSKKYEMLLKSISTNNADNDMNGVILHTICKHDEQNLVANLVANQIHNNNIQMSAYYTEDGFKITEEEYNEFKNLNSKYKLYVEIDGEYKYESPKVTVLSLDKYGIINEFLSKPNPTILFGVAGSGKTEVMIRLLQDISVKSNNSRILYITFSENLVDEVVKRCSTFSHTNIEFHSLKSLINKIFNRKFDCTFENIETFKSFVKLYSIQSNDIDYVKRDKLIKFINNNDIFKIYSEIYGLIMGYMLNEWNRTSIEYISLNEYKNSIKDYSLFEEEKDIIYAIAIEYIDYIKKNGIYSYNIECMKLPNIKIYDYILVDEVQDLTETQINAIVSISKNSNNLFFCGDVKQIINPTFFEFGRLKKLFYEKLKKDINVAPGLTGNYRNSKSVTNIINKLNDIRNEKLSSLKKKDQELEQSKNVSSGCVYNYCGNVKELFEEMNGSNFAIIVDEKEKKICKENNIDDTNIYTIQDCKGLEFENVCVLNILSNQKNIFDEIYESNIRIKDKSLHYNFNLYYVAITRAKYNLILIEKEKVKINEELINMNFVENITDSAELNLYNDRSASSYYEMGKSLINKGLFSKAKQYFEKSFIAVDSNEFGIEKINMQLDICDIYMNEKNEFNLSKIFEEKGFYEHAIKHYRNLNNNMKVAILLLNLGKIQEFEDIIKQYNIDIFNLYSEKNEYNEKIDNYLKNKVNIFREKINESEFYITETIQSIDKMDSIC